MRPRAGNIASRVFWLAGFKRNNILVMIRILMWLAGGVPIFVLAGALYFQRWLDKGSGVRLPTEDKLLRPAGYTLSREIEALTQGCARW